LIVAEEKKEKEEREKFQKQKEALLGHFASSPAGSQIPQLLVLQSFCPSRQGGKLPTQLNPALPSIPDVFGTFATGQPFQYSWVHSIGQSKPVSPPKPQPFNNITQQLSNSAFRSVNSGSMSRQEQQFSAKFVMPQGQAQMFQASGLVSRCEAETRAHEKSKMEDLTKALNREICQNMIKNNIVPSSQPMEVEKIVVNKEAVQRSMVFKKGKSKTASLFD
jgi:hypothetical protein